MKKRSAVINIIESIMIIAIGVLLFWQGITDLTSRVGGDMKREMRVLEAKVDEYVDMTLRFFGNYELVQKHFAGLASYYLSHTKDPYSEETLSDLREYFGVQAVGIIDPKGNLLASAGEMDMSSLYELDIQALTGVTADSPISDIIYAAPAVMPMAEYPADETEPAQTGEDDGAEQGTGFLPEELRAEQTQFSPDDPEEETSGDPADMSGQEKTYDLLLSHFVSCRVDPGHIVLLHDNMDQYTEAVQGRNNAFQFARGVTYGLNGTFFYINSSGEILHGDDNSPAENSRLLLPDKGISDGYTGLFAIDGNWYYCAFRSSDTVMQDYLVCALPVRELIFPLVLLCLTHLIIVLFSLVLMRLYAGLLSREVLLWGSRKPKAGAIQGRLFVLMILCAVVTAGFSMYTQTLYLYSTSLSSNTLKTANLHETVEPINRMNEYGTQIYQNAAATFTRTAAALVSENPEFEDREKLAELAGAVGADHILIYDTSGKVKASDMNYTGLTLSGNPSTQSGAFKWVIYGQPILIQEEVDEDFLNQPYLFSAAPLQDEEGNYRGMVQLAIDPEVRTNLAFISSLESILASFDSGGNTVALAVENGGETVYSSHRPYDGESASDIGLTEEELSDGYTGFFILQLKKLIGCCQLSDSYRIIVATFTQRFPLRGMRSGFASAMPGVGLEFLFFLLLLIHIRVLGSMPREELKTALKEVKEDTEKAELTILRYVQSAVFFGSLLITCVFLTGSILFREMSPGYYAFVYPWSKGLNIFTVTRCLCCICFSVVSITILMRLLGLLGSLLPSKQETFIRLLLSFCKYIGGLGVLYFCLTLFGVSTASLLASAGALTVIFSIGAQSIVADILAGLFIIFEGSFKVGDMITVDDWHGQVVEIGIRNTTIRDLIKSDVRIINNSAIKKVINFSEYPSLSPVRIGVDYSTDIKKLDEIMEREKPVLKKNLPMMIGDVRYLGVDEFADSAIILKFEAACKNQNDLKMKRALSRELLLMFARNGIHVPFPQVVVHEAPQTAAAKENPPAPAPEKEPEQKGDPDQKI